MNEQLQNAIEKINRARKMIEDIEGKPMSDATLCSRFLRFSSTVWSKVNSGTYTGSMDNVLKKCEDAAADMDDRIDAIAHKAERSKGFLLTHPAKAAIGAYQKARDDAYNCRLVVFLAPTGAGKSTILHHIESRYGATFIEGVTSWRNSYKAFCADVADALGSPIPSRNFDERTAEKALLSALGSRSGTLVIDEANTLGASTANAIKLIINKTDYTIVLAATPEMWDTFTAGAVNEVRQVLNRCQAVLRFSEVPQRDIDLFLPKDFTGDRKDATKRIAAAATEFGAYKTVKRICDNLASIPTPDMADVEKAIELVKLSQDSK